MKPVLIADFSSPLGPMEGALGELRAPVTADRLDPFVEPSLCVAYLNTR